jgi:hypothetical protein
MSPSLISSMIYPNHQLHYNVYGKNTLVNTNTPALTTTDFRDIPHHIVRYSNLCHIRTTEPITRSYWSPSSVPHIRILMTYRRYNRSIWHFTNEYKFPTWSPFATLNRHSTHLRPNAHIIPLTVLYKHRVAAVISFVLDLRFHVPSFGKE